MAAEDVDSASSTGSVEYSRKQMTETEEVIETEVCVYKAVFCIQSSFQYESVIVYRLVCINSMYGVISQCIV